MPSHKTRRHRGGKRGGAWGMGPSDAEVKALQTAVDAATTGPEFNAFMTNAKLDPNNPEHVKQAKALLGYVDGQVTYDGSQWFKGVAKAFNASSKYPVSFNPTSPTGMKLECTINPGMGSSQYNYTVHGDTGDTMQMAYDKASNWKLSKGWLSLGQVGTALRNVGATVVAAVATPFAIVASTVTHGTAPEMVGKVWTDVAGQGIVQNTSGFGKTTASAAAAAAKIAPAPAPAPATATAPAPAPAPAPVATKTRTKKQIRANIETSKADPVKTAALKKELKAAIAAKAAADAAAAAAATT